MKITDIRATTVTVPLEAPLRHANGCHWGRFVRTIVEVETDNGLIGLGEMGGGGESAEAVFRAMKSYLVGHDPARLEEMRFLIANPTASLYNNRTQVLAALEFACLDILGKAWGVPVYDILGGKLRDRVPFASYCFFRYPDPRTGEGEVRTIDQVVENARALKRRYGFTTVSYTHLAKRRARRAQERVRAAGHQFEGAVSLCLFESITQAARRGQAFSHGDDCHPATGTTAGAKLAVQGGPGAKK